MGVQDLQTFLETGPVDKSRVDVELIKVARSVAQKWSKTHKKGFPGNNKLSLVVDAECCLDRLYGGFYSDWACGGQWNRVTTFLGQFVSCLSSCNIEMVVFFNGCSEPSRNNEWIRNQIKNRGKINQVLKHLTNKGTPPPKVWWVPPSGLRSVLRMVLRNLNVPVIVTMDDHKQEVIAYCRENGCHGIVADDAEYIAFDPPRYFSARHLKLTYKGTLETREYILSELFKYLELNGEEVCLTAALLGNNILTEEDLSELQTQTILSLKREGEGEGPTDGNWNLVRAMASYVKGLGFKPSQELEQLTAAIFSCPERRARLKLATQYYLDGTKAGFLKYRSGTHGGKKKKIMKALERMSEAAVESKGLASEAGGSELDVLVSASEAKACLQATAEDPQTNGEIELPAVAQEVMRTVNERTTKGLMSPTIHQILTKGELRLPVVMEDEAHKELPSIQVFYRPLRQMVYAILFNLHHLTYMARAGGPQAKLPELKVKEWLWSRNNPFRQPEVVKAEPLGWGVPTLQRLWFGSTVDDKRRRLRAFLTVMRSDTPLMLNPTHVPQHLLILATVLRYMMSYADWRVLRRHELDAVIAMALDPNLNKPEYSQELSLDPVSPRAVHLGAMLMTGIEYGLLANDACGAPIPWLMACPWLYFDGKLLVAHLARASVAKNILELCSHRIPQVMKVERMREAVLEGLMVQWARPIMAMEAGGPMGTSSRPAMGPPGLLPASPRGPSAPLPPTIRGRGGRLEIAGVVVGNWGPNCRLPHEMLLPPQVTSVGGGLVRGRQGPAFITGKGRGGRRRRDGAKRGNTKKTASASGEAADKKKILRNSEKGSEVNGEAPQPTPNSITADIMCMNLKEPEAGLAGAAARIPPLTHIKN